MAPMMEAPMSRKRSLTDMQHSDASLPTEFSDEEYAREVLLLEPGRLESLVDEDLARQADTLGIIVSRPATVEHATALASMRASTVESHHVRTYSTDSHHSDSTDLTSRSSQEQLQLHLHRSSSSSLRRDPRAESRPPPRPSFLEYEKYVLQAEAQGAPGACVRPANPINPASVFSASRRKSYTSIKKGFTSTVGRLRRSRTTREGMVNSCVCCRNEFKSSKALQMLPCLHSYCDTCLRVLITQASNDESKMPPRCCSRAIPGVTIQTVLSREEQQAFMKNVIEFNTPWEARIFCPNTACAEFIPWRGKIDPKHPFELVCRKCRTRACSICKQAAHPLGQDCPADWDLDAVLQMGENAGWRRCYKCRNLVELVQGCSHITCRCKAQFCYICGAVWDPTVGCPNYCNGEEELERRRLEEEARAAEEEAEKVIKEEAARVEAIEKREAEKRSEQSEILNALRAQQINERDRFSAFERKMKWVMWTRHGQAKLDLLNQYSELLAKMKERHLKTSTHLEDRQVGAEMELRATLKQSERSVQIRLKHMEAYCDGLGRSATDTNPARVVTERDLRELEQQYNLRDDLERLHQAKINVMRDKQAKQMENLAARHDEELARLDAKQTEELLALDEALVGEEEAFVRVFGARRARLRSRWSLVAELERRRLEAATGLRFAAVQAVVWHDRDVADDEAMLEVVSE
ncbi:IBR domain-containing protein [Phlyctema vagabunda]|uniref:RBR-type E3 ubiquitin transferase n=1 Tax=Phlyctema vagabunda TaxID=108571 RepID=A0ABR4PAL3_9HELO